LHVRITPTILADFRNGFLGGFRHVCDDLPSGSCRAPLPLRMCTFQGEITPRHPPCKVTEVMEQRRRSATGTATYGRTRDAVSKVTAAAALSRWHLALSLPGWLLEAPLKDFHDLHVWERSHRLTLAIYAATLKFPREELYGLRSPIRRCAVSVGAKIADELSQIRKMFELSAKESSCRPEGLNANC
jgi:hypothetical protein